MKAVRSSVLGRGLLAGSRPSDIHGGNAGTGTGRQRLPPLDIRFLLHGGPPRHLAEHLRPGLLRRQRARPAGARKGQRAARVHAEDLGLSGFPGQFVDCRQRPRHGEALWLDACRHRAPLRRRPQRHPRDLVDGIELRRRARRSRSPPLRSAGAGDARLRRPLPCRICAHAARRGAEDPAEPRHLGEGHDRLVGRRHGPDPVHPDELPHLRRGRRRQWPPRHLALGAGYPRLRRQSPAAQRLGDRQDLGLRGRAAGRRGALRGPFEDARPMGGARFQAAGRQAVSAAVRAGRAEDAGRPRGTGLPDDAQLLRHQALQQFGLLCARRRAAGRPDRRLWRR